MSNVVTIVAAGLGFPEGPYEMPDGSILVQDPRRHRINVVDRRGLVETWVETPNAGTGGIVFNRAGYAFATAGNGTNAILRITPDRSLKWFITDHDGTLFLGPNDLAMHHSGHIFFSDPGTFATAEHSGGFYRADFSGRTVKIAGALGFPNGVTVSPDGGRVYLAETLDGTIRAFDVTRDGEVTGSRVLAEVGRGSGEGGPDGMCVDERGNVYAAIFSGGMIRVVSPEGALIRDIEVGAARPTNCCFGGPDLRTLYVTEAETGTLRAVVNDVPGAPPVVP